jgi:hypothetical protein
MPFVGRIQGVRGLFEGVVLAGLLMEKLYKADDSKNDEAKGNHKRDPYRNGW